MTGPAFSDLPLRPELLPGIARNGWTTPTAIQAEALPVALAGTDVIGRAHTGSGKTGAFGLALLQRLDVDRRVPQALVLSPTRELARQLTADLRALAVGLEGTRILAVTGGAPSRPQRDALTHGVHVIVGTPGRVLQHLELGRIDPSALDVLVLDEADRMLDMGFADQVLSITRALPRDRQSLLFSATWPDGLDTLAGQVLQGPVEVGVDTLVDEEVLRQRAVFCEPDQRPQTLRRLLGRRAPGPTLVFCETKQQCRDLARDLARSGASVRALHGDLEQRDRDEVLVQLRNESVRILVATNVAARGLDLDGLELVVCYELSPDPKVHVHRIGRTARARASGEAISLVAGDREARRLADIEAHLDTTIPELVLDHDAPPRLDDWRAPHQTVVILGGRRDKLRPGDILGALTGIGGVEGSDVGKIVFTDRRCWVAVRAEVAAQAARRLDRGRIKKKRFRVRLVD